MNAIWRNKKCLFLNYLREAVRKKGMTNRPARNIFFNRRNDHFLSGVNDVMAQAASRWAAL